MKRWRYRLVASHKHTSIDRTRDGGAMKQDPRTVGCLKLKMMLC